MFLSFCFSSSKHNVILLLKYTCVEFISIKQPRKNHIKHGKNNYPSRKGVGGPKEKRKKLKSKTPTLRYFDNLKKKQRDQGGKNWCYTQSFKSLTSNIITSYLSSQISELLHSVLKILSSWNKFWTINTMSFAIPKK